LLETIGISDAVQRPEKGKMRVKDKVKYESTRWELKEIDKHQIKIKS
jgi:hypothetical protein